MASFLNAEAAGDVKRSAGGGSLLSLVEICCYRVVLSPGCHSKNSERRALCTTVQCMGKNNNQPSSQQLAFV